MTSTISYYIVTANVVVTDNVATITPTAITTDTGAAVTGTLAGFVQAGGTVCGGGCTAPVASVSSAGIITTAPVWTGASGTGIILTVQMVPRGTNVLQSSVSALTAVNELNDAAAAGTRLMDADAAGSLTNIDALVDCYLVRMDLTAPPDAIIVGACYLVAAGATGDWAGYDGKIAAGIKGGWKYLAPYNGMTVYNAAAKAFYFYENEAFTDLTSVLGIKIGENVQAYNATLAALAKLTKAAGLARQDADGNWAIDTAAYLSALVGSPLAAGKLLIGNANGAAAAVTPTGDVTIDSAGKTALGKIGGHDVSVSGAATDGALYSLSFTLKGNTAVTFPQSGTLVMLENANTFTAVQTVNAAVNGRQMVLGPNGLFNLSTFGYIEGHISYGGYFNAAGQWTALLSGISDVKCGNGYVTVSVNTGLTVGGTFSPVEITRTSPTGLGIGVDPGCALHIKKGTSPVVQVEGNNGGAGYLNIIDTSGAYGGVSLLNGSGVAKWMLGNNGLGTENFGIYTSTGSGVALRWMIDAEGLTPATDGGQTVGNAFRRVGQIYSTNSANSTSWSQKKANARALKDAEISCAQKLASIIGIYQFEDAIAEKGVGAARWHCGVIADTNQKLTAVGAVQTVCEKWGIDPLTMGFFCRDPVTKEIPKTTTHQAQKTKLVTTKPEKIITSADGTQIATYDTVEMYESVWVTDCDGNDIWYDLTDSDGNVLKDADGNVRKYRKPVLEDVLDAGTDTVYVLSDGTYSTDSTNPLMTYSYSIRYEELLCFIAAGQYQAQLKSDAALKALTETVAALSSSASDTSSAT